MRYRQGTHRNQLPLFPGAASYACVSTELVQAIDAFVEGLDLVKLGFSKPAAASAGRPAYDPKDLLKLLVYGAVKNHSSIRSLALAARRKPELGWLLRGLAPSFKTLADFRKLHREAWLEVVRRFAAGQRGRGDREPIDQPKRSR